MELELLEQPKNIFSIKSPTSFFSAFRRKPRAKPLKPDEEIHSHKGSFLNVMPKEEEQTPRSLSNWTKDGQTFDMWSDLSTPKGPNPSSTKPLRKSILIRTTSLPISNKKPIEETTTLKENGKGPLKKMAMWLGGMKESAKSNPCSLTDNLAREKKNKKVTFAIEDEANKAAEQLLAMKPGKKLRKSIKPTPEGDEDTSIEFIETNNQAPFGDLRFRPSQNNDYLFQYNSSDRGFRPKVTAKPVGNTANSNTRNLKHSEIVSSSDSENEIDNNDFGLKPQSGAKIGRRQTTEDHTTKLPMIATPLTGKQRNATIADLQPESLPTPTGARKLGSFSVRGASTVNLANMLYPIKRNIRVERDINRDYDFNVDVEKIMGNDSDFSSKVDVKLSTVSQRDLPMLGSEPNLRLLMNTPNYPKTPSLAIGKRHASLGIGSKAAEL